MNFRLTYHGPLKAASQSDTRRKEKHAIRLIFDRQIKQLLHHKNVLRDEVERVPERWVNLLVNVHRFKRGEFSCFPIVRDDLNLVCDLDILFLRRENPGSLIQAGGDLDNRIKTLFDSLRVPQDDNEVRGFVDTSPKDSLLYCVTENDAQITGFRVTTDRLLEPAASEEEKNNVELIINVEVKATKLTPENLGYFSHF